MLSGMNERFYENIPILGERGREREIRTWLPIQTNYPNVNEHDFFFVLSSHSLNYFCYCLLGRLKDEPIGMLIDSVFFSFPFPIIQALHKFVHERVKESILS